jgi:magnesium-transporting ATPase (P-type)
LVGLAYVHVPINSRLGTGPACVIIPGIYITVFGVSNLLMFSMGPSMGMLGFGLLTIRNVRGMIKRVVPKNMNNPNQEGSRPLQKTADRQLIKMMILQSVFFIVTGTPTSFHYFYTAAMANVPLNALEKARINLTSTIISFIAIAGPCLSFYVFTLSSHLFRRELVNLLRCGRRTVPMNTGSTTNATQRN